ncbi:POK6 protein, partial [Phaetusa simplex]|nr:POK6 protein [Phaetusa simplex]
IIPQQVKIQADIKTLNDLQKLLGAINWVRPLLGIPNHELSPLFSLLKGNSDLLSP